MASSSAASNGVEGGKHIQSSFVDFVPHPPSRFPAYANLGEAMDLTFGSFRFLAGKEGSHHFLAPIISGPLAVEPESSGSSTPYIDSGDEEISPPRFTKPADSGKLADLFGGVTFGSTTETDLLRGNDSNNLTNFDFTNNINFTASEEVFADLYDSVTYPLHGVRMPSLAPRIKNSMIQDLELDDSADSTRHQICMLSASGHDVEEDEQSEAFDPLGNPYVDPVDLTKGIRSKYARAEPREQIQLFQAAWDRAAKAINGTEPMTTQATTEELTTYQYKLSRTRRELQKMQEKLDARKVAADAYCERRANLSVQSGNSTTNSREPR